MSFQFSLYENYSQKYTFLQRLLFYPFCDKKKLPKKDKVSHLAILDRGTEQNFIVYFFLVSGCTRHLHNPATKCDLPIG
jgi:hypothetical protein